MSFSFFSFAITITTICHPARDPIKIMEVSRFGTISLAVAVVALALLGTTSVSAQSASKVKARYHYYNPQDNSWSLHSTHAYCAAWDDSNSLSWKQKYGWAAFCGSSGPTGQAACGKCLKVTNVNTGASVTVRIVDKCTYGALTLDSAVFKELDTNHNGLSQGYLTVNYNFVAC